MVGLGMLYIPLKDVVGMLSWQYFVVVISVVFTVIATGFFVSRFMNMNPLRLPLSPLARVVWVGLAMWLF